jgi:uncharacterized protein (TIGR02118 family)
MITRRTAMAGGAALAASPALAAGFGKELPGFKLTAFLRPNTGPQLSDIQRLAGLGRVLFNTIDMQASSGSPYGTAIEMWFPSGPPPSLPVFGAGSLVMTTLEVQIRLAPPGPPPRAKRMGLVRRREGQDRQAFQASWRNDHAPIADAAYNLRRYELNLAMGPEGPWDGYAEMWWDSFADMAESGRRIAAEPDREAVSPFGAVLLLRMTEER